MWMNRMEIEDAERILGDDPLMGGAARFLKSYMELVDDNSDGWPYWRAGTKCADTLSQMLHDAMGAKRGFTYKYVAPTKEEVVRAVGKIKGFIKRNQHLKTCGQHLL